MFDIWYQLLILGDDDRADHNLSKNEKDFIFSADAHAFKVTWEYKEHVYQTYSWSCAAKTRLKTEQILQVETV